MQAHKLIPQASDPEQLPVEPDQGPGHTVIAGEKQEKPIICPTVPPNSADGAGRDPR